MARASLWLPRVLTIAVVASGFGAFAASALAQQPGSSELRFVVKTTQFESRLSRNCDLFFDKGLSTSGGAASEDGAALGAFDLTRRSGEAYIKLASWQVERLPLPGERGVQPSVSFTNLGIALQKKTAFLTGRIAPGPVLIAASRRVKLAAIRGARIKTGPLLDRRGHAVAGTFGFSVIGTLTMLPAMSRALEAQRCKSPHVTTSRHIQTGYTIGRFAAGLLPGRAIGLAGHAAMFVFAGPTDPVSPPVTVEATNGSTLESEGHVAAPLALGPGVPLTCIDGEDCTPIGGFDIAGGFDLVLGARRASVANLAVALAGAQQTITGTVDGTPVTVAVGELGTEPDFTSEFDQLAGAALGVGIDGGIKIDPVLTTLGPAG